MGYDEPNFLGGSKIIFGHRRRINWRSYSDLAYRLLICQTLLY